MNKNNGGDTEYYDFDPSWKGCQDIIEARTMNFAQGNILKSAFCFNTFRHKGTSYERELNKIIWFATRELTNLKEDQHKHLVEKLGFEPILPEKIKIPGDIIKLNKKK